jgi:hypothetical protein
MSIYINASDIAAFSGHNKYAKDYEVLEKFARYNSRVCEQYGLCKDVSESALEREFKRLSVDEQEQIKKECKIDADIGAETVLAAIRESAGVVENSQIKNAIVRDQTMQNGKEKESVNLNDLEKKENIKIVQRNASFMKKNLCDLTTQDGQKYVVVVGGKVDGIVEETSTLVETKNRQRRLFGEIPLYEKVQLEMYMFLTDTRSIMHIEHYGGQSNKTLYNADSAFFDEIVKNCKDYLNRLLVKK